jgi:hypothetical protein
MAATAWGFFNKAKKLLAQETNGIRLDSATQKFKMSLHTSAVFSTSASARAYSLFSALGNEIVAQGGYWMRRTWYLRQTVPTCRILSSPSSMYRRAQLRRVTRFAGRDSVLANSRSRRATR